MNMECRALRLFRFGLTGALCVLAMAWPSNAREVRKTIGSAAEQMELGLVTVAGWCAGTLLNQYWVLTADRCLATDKKQGGPDRPLEQMTVTAAWRNKTVTPIRSVRFWNSNDLDVALLFLGHDNFRKSNTRLIYPNAVDNSMTLTKFWLPGVDGGEPDYVTDPGDGTLLGIARVTSTCHIWDGSICLEFQLFTIRDDILRLMKEAPPPLDVGIVANRPRAAELQTKPEILSNRRGAAELLTAPDKIVSNRTGAAIVAASANCKPGFVWRLARPDDLVCVTPDSRARTALDNAESQDHVDPAGAYGPNTCLSGYVWRNAFDGDAVCVTPATRALVSEENRLDPTRRAN